MICLFLLTPLVAKEAMGHTCVETTLIYTKLIHLGEGDYDCMTTKDVIEAKTLIEKTDLSMSPKWMESNCLESKMNTFFPFYS